MTSSQFNTINPIDKRFPATCCGNPFSIINCTTVLTDADSSCLDDDGDWYCPDCYYQMQRDLDEPDEWCCDNGTEFICGVILTTDNVSAQSSEDIIRYNWLRRCNQRAELPGTFCKDCDQKYQEDRESQRAAVIAYAQEQDDRQDTCQVCGSVRQGEEDWDTFSHGCLNFSFCIPCSDIIAAEMSHK